MSDEYEYRYYWDLKPGHGIPNERPVFKILPPDKNFKFGVKLYALTLFILLTSCAKQTTKPVEVVEDQPIIAEQPVTRINHTTTFKLKPGCYEVSLAVNTFDKTSERTTKYYFSRKDTTIVITTDKLYLNYIFSSRDKPDNLGMQKLCNGQITLNGVTTTTTQCNAELNLYER